ncbi:hypothetical protein FH608_046360 [Nonomuraea phyllanthi]|uniref:Uncharacterized protein n=1 Tax=Nonomuraea phyllanthi TaxID=2219224 RepID=A0A5C4V6E3_9ACTN|nr:hypothetical protein [Nonomuraea phyllanthi]KAB8186917.1 hypothetical protein FH608_046360 [Nonomuraea phyllanthi]
MPAAEEVSSEMLAALAYRFANGTSSPEGSSWTAPHQAPETFEVARPIRFRLDGFTGQRNVIGTDGSVTPECEHAGFAAVSGDGHVTVGTCHGPRMNSQTAEMQAVRFALRRSGEGPVTLLLDNQEVIAAVQHMARTRKPASGGCRDRQAVDEVNNLLRRRPITVRHVPDAEGTTTWDRMPSNPLMAAAHRLAWSVRRMRLDGIEPTGAAVDWLQAIAVAKTRRTSTLRDRYETFRRRHASQRKEAS